MKKIIIAIVLLLLIAVYVSIVQSCHIDGSIQRELRITVIDDSSRPVAGASVIYLDHAYQIYRDNPDFMKIKDDVREWAKMHTSSTVTGSDGSAKLHVWLPAAFRRYLFWETGEFRTIGNIEVNAEGFTPYKGSLSSVVGSEKFSINRKNMKGQVTLRRKVSHNNRLIRIVVKTSDAQSLRWL
ncbi:MAG: hypothetical protein PHR77_01250 [Kiritimatiellae bacterium]|nr:hypothetical protein [Kiritimatiellia bacterium]MDD5522031.1 hypothetical protein [Kiritimatiellia bacterium]